jgi:hypothetical protein
MFGILSELIVNIVGKIVGTSVDAAGKQIAYNSSLAAKLISLFSRLLEVEKASTALYNDVLLLASGKEPVTEIAKVPMGRILLQRSTSELYTSVKGFSDDLTNLETYISIYGGEGLHHILSDVAIAKGRYLKAVDILLLAIPTIRASEDLTTGHLVFPSAFPKTESLERIRDRIREHIVKESGNRNLYMSSARLPDEKIRLYNQMFNEMVISETSSRTVHIHSQSDLLAILKHSEEDIAALREARKRLAKFIKDNFPLESILA